MRINFYNFAVEKISFKNDAGETLTYADAPMPPDELMRYYQRLNPNIASWQEDADYAAEQQKKQQYAAVNQQYTTEINNIREAIRLVLDRGGDTTALRAKLTAKQVEYKAALLGVV